MRLKKALNFNNRFMDTITEFYVGKCLGRNNSYWYKDMNGNLLRKEVWQYLNINNKYWL